MPELPSTIIAVTVFPDRARVIRRGTLTLDAGIHQIEFVDLPLTLNNDSIRAAGRGAAVAALLGVDVRRRYFTETPAEKVRALQKQVEELQDQDKLLSDQVSAAVVQEKFAQKLADQSAEQWARGFALGRTQVAQAGDLITFAQQQLTQAQAKQREVTQQRRELARQLEKLNNELKAHQSARPRERNVATVEVEVKQAGDLSIDLTYMVNQASWHALYDIRLSEGAQPSLQLSYLAQVAQNTGEDWNDVALTLSTARPALAAIKPELSPWYINVYAPLPARPPVRMVGARMMADEAPMAMMEMAAAAAPQAIEMEAPSAQVESTGASVTFALTQKASAPSDGTPHKVNVATLELSPQLDHLSAPKLAECAYRRAKVKNQSDYLLLAGSANLFVDGDFIGTQHLDRVAPSEEFELMLGVDERVTVKRELKAREVDKKLLRDIRRLHYGYEIEVQNLRANKIVLDVRDQFPISQHEQIKVKLDSVEPKPSEQTELGELKWQIALDPNAKRALRFDCTIEHPTNLNVVGLP